MLAFVLLCASLVASAPSPTTPTPPPTPVAWKFSMIKSVQARVQSLAPIWDEKQKLWISDFPNLRNDPTDKWAASLDTVNTASVEGALYYLQTEGIGSDLKAACSRKSNMSYIWFYEIKIAQPYFAVAEYGTNTGTVPEYGQFAAMDNGKCSNKGDEFPPACMEFTGMNYHPNLGHYVGGEYRQKHERADYPNNVWFSYPGSCFTKAFGAKNAACLKDPMLQGGLCPKGQDPDGVKCTFNFEVLGYLSIDELVGITNMTNRNTNKPFTDSVDFCKANMTEFDFKTNYSDLDSRFWNDPLNSTANDIRSQKMMTMYSSKVVGALGDAKFMKPFPDVKEMSETNPPCYLNNILCSQSAYGCRRKLLAQICEVCTSPDPACKMANTTFPTLVKQYVPPIPTNPAGKPVVPVPPTAGATAAPGSPPSAPSSGISTPRAITSLIVASLALVIDV
ncbi:hypothetical protein LEN26_011964 [Aphanomyces euteiches]|nr:hypothetical protein LEN26_011964 [Aphanomyces euteiches]